MLEDIEELTPSNTSNEISTKHQVLEEFTVEFCKRFLTKYKSTQKPKTNFIWTFIYYLFPSLVEIELFNEEKEYNKIMKELRKEFKSKKIPSPSKPTKLSIFNSIWKTKLNLSNDEYNICKHVLTKKANKSESGIISITVFTSNYPTYTDSNGKTKTQKFSCKWNCYYCPNEPGQPRSYLLEEPGVLRANRNKFDPILQFNDRAETLKKMGHPIDKVELLILGGTWTSYPTEYRTEFCRDLYYAANTFWDVTKREKLSLEEEQYINETAVTKIIGLTLETRPDTIDKEEIERLRSYGCTRVQLGIQHTDDDILKKINRQSTRNDAVRALKLLNNSCFKADIHLMPNLPGSNPEIDIKMFNDILYSEELTADQWKIYPCKITTFTVIEKWAKDGKFVPYSLPEERKVVRYALENVHPWIRVNRVERDIPSQYVVHGEFDPNSRQIHQIEMDKEGVFCKDIRSREFGLNSKLFRREDIPKVLKKAFLKTYQYMSNGSREYFISYEVKHPNPKKCKPPPPNLICGFVRLRIPKDNDETAFPELIGKALIRELHVYGKLVQSKPNKVKKFIWFFKRDCNQSQHIGFGKMLMKEAERVAFMNQRTEIAVIAGVGTRNYYCQQLFYSNLPGKGKFLWKSLKGNKFALLYDHSYQIVPICIAIFAILTISLQITFT